MPIEDITVWTFGSLPMIAATCFCFSTIAW
jgi:hypothetical protein